MIVVLSTNVQVYLHFAVVSLLASLISPSGRLEDSPVLPALVGLTAVQTVHTAAAARLLQFLLTSSPGMDTTGQMMALPHSALVVYTHTGAYQACEAREGACI